MPRQARNMSASGQMHVIVRGIGRRLLFEDTYDYRYYLKKLELCCNETGVQVCAYCFMDNHVHILMKGENESISLLMKRIGISYSIYFNKKYDRIGHLFQDRYKSEPVDDEKYLLTVFRYILKNPQKAGLCHASQYPWSSYRYYDEPLTFMDLSVSHSLLGDYKHYEQFINLEDNAQCLEYSETRHSDTWAKEELAKCLGIESGQILQNYSRAKRDSALEALKNRGLTIRQIVRLTGIGRNIVQAAGKAGIDNQSKEPSP